MKMLKKSAAEEMGGEMIRLKDETERAQFSPWNKTKNSRVTKIWINSIVHCGVNGVRLSKHWPKIMLPMVYSRKVQKSKLNPFL